MIDVKLAVCRHCTWIREEAHSWLSWASTRRFLYAVDSIKYGDSLKYVAWGVLAIPGLFLGEKKHETKVEEVHTNTENKQCQDSSVSSITKEF